MNILIAGGTGFIGRQLCQHLLANGHHLIIRTRSPESVNRSAFAKASTNENGKGSVMSISGLSQLSVDQKIDVAINLAGEPIANKRWTAKQKHIIRESRLTITQEFITYFERLNQLPALFISSSAIGYYGIGFQGSETPDDEITETSNADNSFSSTLCHDWENCAMQAQALGIRTCILRTGIVLGSKGGALGKMLLPFKCGLGGKIGTGSQWMPWIALSDMISIIDFCIAQKHLSGPINCTAPNPVTNRDFTQALGQVLRRPTLLNMPHTLIVLLMGEMGKELLLSGKQVVPAKLKAFGYTFHHEQLKEALKEAVK